MGRLLPSLFIRVAALGGASGSYAAQVRDRTPVGMAWKDEHSSKIKRLVLLLDDLATLEYDIANVASGLQHEGPAEYSPGPADVAYLAVTARIDLVVGLVAVLLNPVPNPNSPSGKRPPSTSGAQLVLYDILAKRRQTRNLSLHDCPHSVALLQNVPQDISLNCSGDMLLACIDNNVTLFRVATGAQRQGQQGGSGSGWWGSPAKRDQNHRQLQLIQLISADFIGARFCAQLPNRILGLAHPKSGAQSAGMRVVRIDIRDDVSGAGGEGSLGFGDEHDAAMGELPGRVTAWGWDAAGEAVALGTADGVIAMHRCARPESTKKSVAPEGRMVEALAWHPLGAVIVFALEGGMLALLDAALQPLMVVAGVAGLLTDTAVPVVDLASALGMQGMRPTGHRRQVVPLAEWARTVMEPFAPGSMTPLYELAGLAVPAVGSQDFAIGVCQVAVGGLSGGRLRVQELVAQHLCDGEPMRALNLIAAAGDPQAQYHGLQLLLDHMLRGDLAGPHSGAILEILDETLEVMWPQVGLMPDRQRAELVHVIRRYCARLMDQGWLELAFKVAKTCHCIAAAEDVYMKAVQQKETALSQAVWDCIQRIAGDIGLATVSLASPAHLEALERLQINAASQAGPEEALGRTPASQLSSAEANAAGAVLEIQGHVKEALQVYRAASSEASEQALQALVDASRSGDSDSLAAAGSGDLQEREDEYPQSPVAHRTR